MAVDKLDVVFAIHRGERFTDPRGRSAGSRVVEARIRARDGVLFGHRHPPRRYLFSHPSSLPRNCTQALQFGIWRPADAGSGEILRALAIVLRPVVGTVILYGSSSGMETAVGVAVIFFALGLIATWFRQPW
jgi:hypothetical protein